MPNPRLDGFAVKAPAVTPLPESAQVNAEPVAGVTVTVPDALAVVVGVNVTVKPPLAPGARVMGVVMPLRANPVPVAVALLMVMLEPPELVKVAVCFWFWPICTVPNAMMLDPAVVNDPGVIAFPERATFNDALEALLVIATFPLAAPVVFGAKLTEKLALCPAAMVAGRFMPLMVNPVPVTAV